MTISDEYFSLRKDIWNEFEKLVRNGAFFKGYQTIPIITGLMYLPKAFINKGEKIVYNTEYVEIECIMAIDDYKLFPTKDDKDIWVSTPLIDIRTNEFDYTNLRFFKSECQVQPDIMKLDALVSLIDNAT